MERQKTKEKLRKSLGDIPNYVRTIQAELFSKKEISLSHGKISQCLNPKYKDWDNDVIECATALLAQLNEKEQELHDKVQSL